MDANDIPSIAGLDIVKGLSFVGNKWPLYNKVLAKFPERYADFVEQFRLAQGADDPKAAERLAHSLKGVAATIGAMDLHYAAKALEFACRDDASSVDDKLSTLADALGVVLAGIETFQSYAAKLDLSSSSMVRDVVAIEGALRELMRYLAGEVSEGHRVVAQLETLLRGDEYLEDVAALKQAIAESDSDELQMSIDIIASKLNINLET